MEHCDGETPAKRPKLSDGGGSSEDRLSALPQDIIIHILLKLPNATVAARTSVLSNRWRRLWKLLPELWFRSSTDPLAIRSVLESHEVPALSCLAVDFKCASPESVADWLPIAARRLSGHLNIRATQSHEAAEGGDLELPCFGNATSIRLQLEYLGLFVPPVGIFARLTDLFLACVDLYDPCMLGDAVSSPRCPALRKLTIRDAWGVGNMAIHSDSLLQIELHLLHALQQLTIMAPALRLLAVMSCLAEGRSYNQPAADIYAPQLLSLSWIDAYDPRFTKFGKMENLNSLSTSCFIVYARVGSKYKLRNSYCTEILRQWRCIKNLKVIFTFVAKDITNYKYLMEDIARFPNTTNLTVQIMANGHSCGPSLYHLLRMCTGVRNLYLELLDDTGSPEAQTACPSGCVCDQPPNWKTNELALNCLREVEFLSLRGTKHEAVLVKRLFDWATVLETMIVTFDRSVDESKAKKFYKMFKSFSRPEIRFKGRLLM